MEILRNLARRKLRSTLTILGIVIGIFALTTMGAMSEHFNVLFNFAEEWYSSSIPVGPPDGQAALLPLSKIGQIEKVDGVAAAFPGYSFDMKPGQVTTVVLGIPDTIVAYDPREGPYRTPRTSIAQGRNLTAKSRGEVV